jgi:alanine racemase
MFTTPTLTVSLPAIVANWQALRAQFTGEECAAVVKADAYGLGAIEVSRALEKAGCHTFFVATLEEAIALRAALPDVRILVFHGVLAGEEFAFAAHRLIPVLNSIAQIERWKPVAAEHVHAVSALHIDTAMARLGLQPEAFAHLIKTHPHTLTECRVGLILSHFACAPEANHPLNAQQLTLFQQALALAQEIPASLCNSGGIYLGKENHFHLARPGCSLYGIAPFASPLAGEATRLSEQRELSRSGEGAVMHTSPTSTAPSPNPLPQGERAHDAAPLTLNPMHHVATWNAPIIMTRTLEHEQTVGYGATQTLPKGTRIATIASGYADGYLRHLSGKAIGYIGDHKIPLVGRVTMDMLCFDVSHVPEALAHEGATITLLGDKDGIRVDDVAEASGTIGYEVLTRIGSRVKRVYTA